MKKITYAEMKAAFREHELNHPKKHLTGCIVFTEDSFTKEYPRSSRTYCVNSDNKAFQPNMGGYSIYGSSLDGSDNGVRLEAYMAEERGGPRGWKVDYCYMYSAPEILPMDYLALLKLTEDNPPPTGALNELNEDVIIESGCNEMGKFFRLTTCQHNGWMRINYIYEDGSREELYEK